MPDATAPRAVVDLYRQGGINLILNAEQDSNGRRALPTRTARVRLLRSQLPGAGVDDAGRASRVRAVLLLCGGVCAHRTGGVPMSA
ncbi:hypothetical protein ACTMU2_25625 [Cupriavidus basilensis]